MDGNTEYIDLSVKKVLVREPLFEYEVISIGVVYVCLQSECRIKDEEILNEIPDTKATTTKNK